MSMFRSRSNRQRLLLSASAAAIIMGAAPAIAQDMFHKLGSNPSEAAAAAAANRATQNTAASTATVRTIEAFQRASQIRARMDAAQAQARAAAQAAQASVANGLASGGLQVANGVTTDPTLWTGANGPIQSQGTNGRTTVWIDQTQSSSILTWDSFNIGRETDLIFDQHGNTDWAVLNRVTSVQTDPTKILGTIKADGTVMILNRNGVIFSGTSQVNARNIVAAAANITNEQFLNRGIYSAVAGNQYAPVLTSAAGAVSVDAGAQLTTAAPSSVLNGGGYVLLAGTSVINAGTITTVKGQTLLAGGDNFIIRAGVGTESNTFSTTRGNEVRALMTADSGSGSVTNTGSITATQGDITLTGRNILQDGVLLATTSVNQRGTIHLSTSAGDTTGLVTLTGNSLTAILPELDSDDTALNAQRDALISDSTKQDGLRAVANFGQFDNQTRLADRRDQSRVEIVSGGNVLFDAGSTTLAQGGQVAVTSTNRIQTETGAIIDVSGVRGVALDGTTNVIKINVQGNELRDSPLNRDQPWLKSQDVWIDIRDLVLLPAGTGDYATDRYYTAGGLLEVSGYLANTEHSIGEWSAVGGTITLAANEVVSKAGSIFNIAGGSIDYTGGLIPATRVLGADGKLYDLGNAPSSLQYYAVGNALVVTHDRWGPIYTQVYSTPLFSRGTYTRQEDAYSVGRDGGKLILSSSNIILDGDIVADTIAGSRQVSARPATVVDGYKLGQTSAPLAGSLALQQALLSSEFQTIASNVTIGGSTTPTQDDAIYLDSDALSRFGLGGISVLTTGDIALDAPLSVASGGSITLSGHNVAANADITARGGSIWLGEGDATLYATSSPEHGNVTLTAGATLDTRGLWTNALLDPDHQIGLAFLDGGSVTLRATGDVTLEQGSVIDASAGGAILSDGSTQGGAGGNISLVASHTYNSLMPNDDGKLTLDGQIHSYGFTHGGALTLQTGEAIVIGSPGYTFAPELEAGKPAAFNLTLTEPLTISAGTPLPLAFSQSVTALPTDVPLVVPTKYADVTINADWTVPEGIQSSIGPVLNYRPAGTNSILSGRAGSVIPAGSTVFGNVTLPAGYVPPSSVFGASLPLISPVIQTYSRGSVLTADATYAAGTALPAGTILATTVQVKPIPILNLTSSLFDSGFGSYSVNGVQGLIIAKGAQIVPAEQLYQFSENSFALSTGGETTQAGNLYTPAVYIEDPKSATLTKRPGVDLSFLSGANPLQAGRAVGGSIIMEGGASIAVDPGASVTLASGGQITVAGAISSPGGHIVLANNRPIGGSIDSAYGVDPGALSVLVDDGATLDVSAQAYVANDLSGRAYGVVPNGGTITLGGDDGQNAGTNGTDAFVVVRSGATLAASGTHAELDLLGGAALAHSSNPVLVASDGGAISLNSNSGIFVDGTVRSLAGGNGAAGGTLNITLGAPTYTSQPGVGSTPATLQVARVLTLSDNAPSADNDWVVGNSLVRPRDIAAGGFDSLSLYGYGGIAFDGDVSLSAGRSIALAGGALFDTVAHGHVTVSAAYVLLNSPTSVIATSSNQSVPDTLREVYPSGGEFRVDAGLIDVRNLVRPVFENTVLSSSGDLRFLGNTDPAHPNLPTMLAAAGDLSLVAQQIYPDTNANAAVYAGVSAVLKVSREVTELDPARAITISKVDATTPDVPYSVFGQISFQAGQIEQGGTVRAPLGSISLIASSRTSTMPDAAPGNVELLPGSLTSVSANGLLMPYGGTVDGVKYTLDGAAVTASSLFGTSQEIFLRGVSLKADAGSLLDLSGGGVLTGTAFISGRGGSVDILATPLINANPANGQSSVGNKVYAIVPTAKTAPVSATSAATWSGALPTIGEQVTVPAGIPGLPAGTYMLMPATYALLPGAFRVEVGTSSTRVAANTLPNGAGSYFTSGYIGVANTDIRGSLPVDLIVTPAAAASNYAQYNQQSYDDFFLANAATFGSIRPLLEADGKFLHVAITPLHADSQADASTLNFEGKADFSPSKGGYSGAFALTGVVLQPYTDADGISHDSITANLEITGPNGSVTRTSLLTPVSAASISAINAPILYIDGVPQLDGTTVNVFAENAITGGFNGVTVDSGVSLQASQIIFGKLDKVSSGATITTLGGNAPIPDSSLGFLFAAPLIVSNGNILAPTPSHASFSTPIYFDDGSAIYAKGTIVIGQNSSPVFAGDVHIAAPTLELLTDTINLGDPAALAAANAGGLLPTGLNLDQGLLDQLLKGSPGAPAVEHLVLAAYSSVNTFGSVDLTTLDPATGKSRLEQFVLYTPAIYGYGAGSDTVNLTTGTFVWSGIDSVITQNPLKYSAGLPGATIDGGAGSGSGKFAVHADQIVFGYPTQSRPGPDTLDRLMLGYSQVEFAASTSITSNNAGNLAVFQSGPGPDANYDSSVYAGQGGALTLTTPLLTGAAGSSMAYRTGGSLVLATPAGATISTATPSALGAQIDLVAATITDATRIYLPTGKLTMTAPGDIVLTGTSRVELSGQTVPFFDVDRYTWGGDAELESSSGNIVQHEGSVIDVSAAHADAGTVKLTATAQGAGAVLLNGTLLGSGDIAHGSAGGAFDIRAQRIGANASNLSADFATLNGALDTGGFSWARAFDLKQGNLTIGADRIIAAHNIAISIDNGALTVDGKLDASGATPGDIRLASRGDLLVSGSAIVDVHGNVLQVDSYGAPIDAKNRGHIELTTVGGVLTLAIGAEFDLSSPDGISRGSLVLNAPRTGSSGSSATGAGAPSNGQGTGIAISAAGPLDIRGASEIALNGVAAYANAPADPNGPGQVVTQQWLDLVDQDSQAFIANLYGGNVAGKALSSGVAGQVAGLSNYGTAFHIRPGVEIDSATPDGDITLSGVIDLAAYRYGPGADRDVASPTYGAGEPLNVVVRAGGNLFVNGSITDGFAQSPNILTLSGQAITAPLLAPFGGTLLGGAPGAPATSFVAGVNSSLILPFDAVVRASTTAATALLLRRGVSIPFVWVSTAALTFPAWVSQNGNTGFALTAAVVPGAAVTVPAGATVTFSGRTYSAGQQIPANTTIPAGTRLPANIILPTGTRWAANSVLPSAVATSASGALPAAGPLALPAGTPLNVFQVTALFLASNVDLPANTTLPAGLGAYGTLSLPGRGDDALDPMLRAGSQSASIRLVAGADVAAAATRTLGSTSALGARGNLVANDAHFASNGSPIFSVIRTGTGDLDVLAGRDIDLQSLYGIYTAGTQVSQAPTTSPSYYVTDGGDLYVQAQKDLEGFQTVGAESANISADTGKWLWQQPSAAAAGGGAWSINFGNSVSGNIDGFTGFGTLGGGNLNLIVGGDAGELSPSTSSNSGGLVLAVASTGFASSVQKASDGTVTGGTLTQFGGGDLRLKIGGELNPAAPRIAYFATVGTTAGWNGSDGVFTSLRGDIDVHSGSIGGLVDDYGRVDPNDPRGPQPFASTQYYYFGAPTLVTGDSVATLQARGDIAFGGVRDATGGGASSSTRFTLWQPTSAVELSSAGGDINPAVNTALGASGGQGGVLYTPTFGAVAASGNLYLQTSIELAPSPVGQLDMFAQGSILGGGAARSQDTRDGTRLMMSGKAADANSIANVFKPNTSTSSAGSFFAFGADLATGDLHVGDTQPIHIYAVNGDIIDVSLGYLWSSLDIPIAYAPLKAVHERAGGDIVNIGLLINPFTNDIAVSQIMNYNDTDVSLIHADGNIYYSNVNVAGPGLLEIQAGHELYQGDKASLVSTGLYGNAASSSPSGGAGIVLLAGVGANGPDYADFAKLYFNDANLADAAVPDTDPRNAGKVPATYGAQLYQWLKSRFEYAGTAADALEYFLALPSEQQGIFVRQAFYDELDASGQEFNDAGAKRFQSYLRGRDAIAALFPSKAPDGAAITYSGSITMFGDAGVQTRFGGSINTLTPGGQTVVGVEGSSPASTAGLITQGSGNIASYALKSILLGQSRIMTSFGGNILAWSAEGDINAGRGSKTDIVFTPPRQIYDQYGNLTQSPQVPSTGAGIATLDPIPEVPAGDINLVAPLGTIDAGEAGIRVSGSINLAALHILNAANIQVKGNAAGIPQVATVNTGALTAASAATGAVANEAARIAERAKPEPIREMPTILNVRFLGFGPSE